MASATLRATAFTGIPVTGLIFLKNHDRGRPPSLANAHVILHPVANTLSSYADSLSTGAGCCTALHFHHVLWCKCASAAMAKSPQQLTDLAQIGPQLIS